MIFIVFLVTLFSFIPLHAAEIDFSPVQTDDIAVLLYDIEKGEEVYALNPDKPLYFASNLKLLTTAAALNYLGGGFRFMTLFSFDTNSGTLYIKAAGDPEIVVEKLWAMANDFKRRGIKNIKKVVVDDYIYGEKGILSAESGDRGDNAYLAFISPLGLNYNSVEIFVKATEIEKPVEVVLSTPGPHFVINNCAVGTKGGEHRLIAGAGAKNGKTEVLLKGSLGVGRKKPEVIYKRVGNPLNHFVETFVYLIDKTENILIERERLSLTQFKRDEFINYTHSSRPLRDILRDMNLYSSNYLADSIQFFMGAVLKGDASKGVDLLKEYSKNHLGEEIDIVNGSGLGNDKNKLNARFYIKLLKKVYDDSYGSVDFFSSLPVMGEDGTLKTVAASKGSAGEIRAKTGSLTGVAALSGLMRAKSGKLYLFAFAVNNFPSKMFKPMWNFRDNVALQLWEQY
ncbi:MAG: D-alanyl-D-alanine carboxypeptidase/D-alanyl-D-alanine endopeptidase [bacterium]